jgi:hypothetical protein
VKELNAHADDSTKRLANHTLHLLQDGPHVTAYYLRERPDSRMMSTLILFTPEGIALMGDLTPQLNGSVSALGYGPAWFAGQLSPDYLCSKFLRKEWVHAIAKRELRERADEAEASGYTKEQAAKWAEIADEFDDDAGPESLYDLLPGFDTSDGIPGMGYEPVAGGWLVAIQRTFARLYVLEAAKKA